MMRFNNNAELFPQQYTTQAAQRGCRNGAAILLAFKWVPAVVRKSGLFNGCHDFLRSPPKCSHSDGHAPFRVREQKLLCTAKWLWPPRASFKSENLSRRSRALRSCESKSSCVQKNGFGLREQEFLCTKWHFVHKNSCSRSSGTFWTCERGSQI